MEIPNLKIPTEWSHRFKGAYQSDDYKNDSYSQA